MGTRVNVIRPRRPARFSDHAARVLSGVAAAVEEAPGEAAVAALGEAVAALRRDPPTTEALTYLRGELDKTLPRLIDRIVADVPAPGEREAVAETGALTRRLGVAKAVLRSPLLAEGRRAGLEKQLVDRIAHAAIYYHRALTRTLETTDPVDIRAVSFDQLRLDVIQWLLEDLGATAAQEAVRSLAHVTARTALRCAGRAVDAYIRTRGPSQRFDVAVVVSQVEDLGTLVGRVLDSVGVDDHGIDSQGALSRALVEDFIHRCGLLVLATFRDIEDRHAAGALSVPALRGALKQVMALRTFIHRIDAPGGTRIRLAVDRTITRRAEMTVRLITDRAPSDPAGARALLVDLAEFLAQARRSDDKGGDGS
ncbi:hypothetical protein ACM64Y_05355 [Novispirillum sp. DQ9]|uniref:hypothetical protein n=1 Tax=Novispirillum sp. DQ9 TaxID=3398612 RepID=UPI003C7CD78A